MSTQNSSLYDTYKSIVVQVNCLASILGSQNRAGQLLLLLRTSRKRNQLTGLQSFIRPELTIFWQCNDRF